MVFLEALVSCQNLLIGFYYYFLSFFFFFFCLLRATPGAFGGSQARDLIGAIAADLCHSHSNARSELHL